MDSGFFWFIRAYRQLSSSAFGSVIEELRSLTDEPIVLYNIYNPFQVKDPLHKVADQYLPQINEVFEDLDDSYRQVELADAYKAFGNNQAKYIIKGDVHPTKAGHAKLAKIGLRAFSRDFAYHHHH